MVESILKRCVLARHHQIGRKRGSRALVIFCSALLLGVGLCGARVTLPGLQFWSRAAPSGNPPAENAVIRQVSIDKKGVITYIKGDGIYVYGRVGGVQRLVKVGDEAPRTGGRFAQFLDVASTTVDTELGEDLRLALRARIDGRVSEGLFLFSENQGISAVALPGDIAPNTGGGAFSQFSGQLLISPRGTIVFKAAVVGGQASEGIFFAFRQLLSNEERIDSLAVQGDPAPETGGGAYAGFVDYALTQRLLAIPIFPFVVTVDVFAYIANVEGGRVSQGLYLSPFIFVPGSPPLFELAPQLLAFPGGKVPGVGRDTTYTEFKSVVLTSPSDLLTINEVVFHAAVTKSSTGEVLEGIFQTAFLGPFPTSSPRVLQGQQAPVPGGRYHFVSFERMAANNSEQLTFVARLVGGGPSEGLFQVTLGPLQVVSATLVTGQAVPGVDGSVYADLGPIAINDDGFVVLQAALSGGDKTEAVFRILAKQARMIDSVP